MIGLVATENNEWTCIERQFLWFETHFGESSCATGHEGQMACINDDVPGQCKERKRYVTRRPPHEIFAIWYCSRKVQYISRGMYSTSNIICKGNTRTLFS
jgi:hypothetical protein